MFTLCCGSQSWRKMLIQAYYLKLYLKALEEVKSIVQEIFFRRDWVEVEIGECELNLCFLNWTSIFEHEKVIIQALFCNLKTTLKLKWEPVKICDSRKCDKVEVFRVALFIIGLCKLCLSHIYYITLVKVSK